MKTILITGCSSGFGLDAARLFLDRGWNVIATMRTVREELLPKSDRLRILPLDVTDPASVAALVAAAGPVDVLVNNAGVGLASVVEGTPAEAVRALFETNFFGPVALTQGFIPLFRERAAGVIVNVSSSVTLKTLPLLSTYTATKAALNAFSEALALELAPFGIAVRVILPGQAPETAFGQNAQAKMGALGTTVPGPYADFVGAVIGQMMRPKTAEDLITRSSQVSEAIWRAATDPSCPTRLPAGDDAVAWAQAR